MISGGSENPQVTPRHPEEMVLVRQLIAGDQEAFRALVDKHNAMMLRVARSFIRQQDLAEEVVQETWMAILKGLPKFQGRSSLKTWMFRILANRARTRAKREGRTIPMSAMGTLTESGEPAVNPDRFDTKGGWKSPPSDWGVTPETVARDVQTRALIEQAIAKLPDRQRLVITLRDLQGFSSDEVRNVLEVSQTNQRVLLHRARSSVRQALEWYYRGANPDA